jgi:predicted MFS family arabinose efflux permease
MPIIFAPLAGPVLAGIILKYAGWPWVFYVNVPVGILAVILAAYVIPRDDVKMQKRPFDFLGFIMLSPALAGLLYGFDRVSHRQDGWTLILSLLLLGVFIWHSMRKKAEALIDFELFRIRTFSAATMTLFVTNGIMFGGQFLIPLFLTAGCHLTATQAGLVLGAMGIGMLSIRPWIGSLTDRFGCRAVSSSGVLLNLLGTLPFIWMAINGFSMTVALIALVIRGAGLGATNIPVISAAYASVPRETLSLAAMTVNIVQRLGGPTITTAIAIATSLSAEAAVASSRSFLVPFVSLVAVQLLALAAASGLPNRIDKGLESHIQE